MVSLRYLPSFGSLRSLGCPRHDICGLLSMPVKQTIEQGAVPVKVYTDDLEASARQQLVNISKLSIVHHHVAAMPDVHAGIGATVGSVIATKQAIIPAAVGVDIGCFTGDTKIPL